MMEKVVHRNVLLNIAVVRSLTYIDSLLLRYISNLFRLRHLKMLHERREAQLRNY